ncbi:MAG TPA: bifunctional riboflavin kinase/FAD synthetase [Bacteroidales bacterium]|nr:bifunctional riboflavin kinase/FAD synthetase [Bacteroidales bacterium]
MRIFRNIQDCCDFRKPVVTIGTFDGVHRGHEVVLSALNDIARNTGGESVVITLWPHPRAVLQPEGGNIRILSTLNEKVMLLEQKGIDNLLVLPFTRELASLSPEEFLRFYLVEKIKVRSLVVGFDHQFGKNREGDIAFLRYFAAQNSIDVYQPDAHLVDGQKVSSTLIRKLLEQGQVEQANTFLGYAYPLTGKVTGGSRIGRTIGFPTANIEPEDPLKLVPAGGVYAVTVLADGMWRQGMLNIGWRPTINDNALNQTIEVHIFDYDQDLYGKNLTLAFHFRLRDEMKFSNVQELKQQLERDAMHTRLLLASVNMKQ